MRKYLQIILIGWLLSAGNSVSYGQQQAMFTQYMFNGLALNPAYAGSHRSLSITALGRRQWVGFEGAPSTQTLSVHSPIMNKNVAVGALFIHDRIGVTDQNGVALSASYQVRFPNGTLSFGTQGGFSNYRAAYSKLSVQHVNDPNFSGDDVNRFMPNVGGGVYYYTNRLYVGFSVPQLLTHYYDPYAEGNAAKQYRHYFLTGGYVFDLNHNYKLKPSVLVKAVEGAPVQVDLNTSLLIKEVLWLGLSYRSFESIDALFEVQLSNQFRIGYAYDFVTSTRVNGIRTASHELMLNYQFTFPKTRLTTPRYF